MNGERFKAVHASLSGLHFDEKKLSSKSLEFFSDIVLLHDESRLSDI